MRHALLVLGLTAMGCAGIDDTALVGRWAVVTTNDATPVTEDGAAVLIHADGTFYAVTSQWTPDCIARETTTGTWRVHPDHMISFYGREATRQGCEPLPHDIEPFGELVYTYELGADLTLRGEYTTTVLQRL